MSENKRKIVLAAGGTGGHIFPAEALSGILAERGYEPILITDKRFKDYSGSLGQFKYHIINSATMKAGIANKFISLWQLAKGFAQSIILLMQVRPVAVVGFGGYPSFPTVYAATFLRIKTVIHEQNSLLGKANYLLAPKMNAIATSFPEVRGISEKDAPKVTLTGNPVRAAVKAIRDLPYPEVKEEGMVKILVTGGSQGARIFSKVVPEALKSLSPEIIKRIRIDQQCRPEDIENVRAIYQELGISADLATFFTDIPARLAAAHLVICRAGASTLAELAVAGRPAIMVPYALAADNHQMVNANAIEDAGGGWVIPEDSFNASTLAGKLDSLMKIPASLIEAANNIKRAGKTDADKALADVVEKIVSG